VAFPYLVDRERRFVRAVLSGTANGRDVALTIEAIYGDGDWRPGFDIIWNCAAISEFRFEPVDVDTVVALRRRLDDAGGPGRDIIIIKRVLDDGMARMYAAMRQHDRRRTHLCASEQTALEILARDRDSEPI
jgi:hypothetical protein